MLRDTRQISRGKFERFRCTTAGFTLRALDGYGLCGLMPAGPALTPQIRFLFIGPHLCLALLSDPASRRRPWGRLSFTSIRLDQDFHPELSNMLGTHKTGPDAMVHPVLYFLVYFFGKPHSSEIRLRGPRF